MLLARDAFGGLGSFGAAPYVPKPSTTSSTPYVPQPSTPTTYNPQASEKRYTAAELQTQYLAFIQQWSERQRIEEWGLAAKLPGCPANSIAVNARNQRTECYGGSAPNLLPPGTFVAYGVPFHVGEFQKGQRFAFSKTVKADEIQRQVVEYQIRRRSTQVFLKLLANAVASNPMLGLTYQNMSIQQAQQLVPEFVVEIRGLKYNPIRPTNDELTERGGLASWAARGGFPLILGVARSEISLDESYTPTLCQSILCNCPGATVRPVSCVQAFITKDGTISQHPGSNMASFWVFFDVRTDGTITVSLDYDEPSKLEKFGQAMASVFESIGKMLCVAAPVAKEQMAAMTLPKCVDKANKPCKQGAADCTCVTPPDSTAVAVGTTNAVMTKWCDAWNKEFAPQQDFPIDNIMPPVEKPFPWVWLIGGLAVFGGAMYAVRR